MTSQDFDQVDMNRTEFAVKIVNSLPEFIGAFRKFLGLDSLRHSPLNQNLQIGALGVETNELGFVLSDRIEKS